MRREEKSTWEKMTKQERKWMTDLGYSEEDVNECPEKTKAKLKHQYAWAGKPLAVVEQMYKRLGGNENE